MKALKLFTLFLLSIVVLHACKKDDKTATANVSVATKDYVFNTATRAFITDESIGVNVKSDVGVESIYTYLIRSNKADSLVNIYFPAEEDNIKDITLNIEASTFIKSDMSAVEGVKLMVKSLNNAAYQGFVKVSPFTPEVPKLTDIPASLLPDNNNLIKITGKASSKNGLKKIEIFDDAEVTFKVIHTIDNLTGNTYDLDYDYTLRSDAKRLKVLLTDNQDYTVEAIINIEAPVTGPFKKYENVVMNAQGIGTANGFIGTTGTFLGACDMPLRGTEVDFFLYTTGLPNSPVLTIYAAGGAGNIIKGYKCNDVEWVLAPGESLKPSKLRVLVTTNSSQSKVYDAIAANDFTSLSSLLAAVTAASSNTAKFGDNFNDTDKNLILVQTPGSKNILIKVKSVALDAGNSSITADIYVEN